MATKAEDTLESLQKKNLEAAMRLAQMSIDNSQRILQIQVDAARDIFDDGVSSAKALAQVKSPQEAMELRAHYAQQTAERMFNCSKSISELTVEMQGTLGKMMNEQISQGCQDTMETMQKMFAAMPMNGNAAAEALQHTFDTARKTLEQVSKASSDAFATFSAQAPAPGKKR